MADQREARGCRKLSCVFPSRKSFGFLPDRDKGLIADQREARGCRKPLCVFPSKKGFGFCLIEVRGPGADQREAQETIFQAVCLPFKLPNSLRLAACMARAASVSDCSWAKRSNSARVTPGRKQLSPLGNSRNNSQGVAQRS
jgi:hypothetical protein